MKRSPFHIAQTMVVVAGAVLISACGGGNGGGNGGGSTSYTVGGSVSGLQGTGLVLQDNAGNDLTIASNGSFVFTTAISTGGAFSVTVKSQPTNVWQTCAVAGGSGTVAATNITGVTVNCVTNAYSVGGAITGLAGSGLVLEDNATDNLSVGHSGTFTFPALIPSGIAYAVTVKTQPTSPSQTCTPALASGTITNASIANVAVSCVTNTYSVSGTVSGLTGTGLVLQDNAGDNLAIAANGSFIFHTAVASGTTYNVTVLTQPGTPTQVCAVAMGAGTIGAGPVSGVVVTCSVPVVACGLENGTVVTHASNISANETWAGNGVVHLIPNSIDILAPATVTVQRCAIVKLGTAVEITVKGDASGTGTAKLLAAGDDPNVGEVYFKSSGSGNWGRLSGYNQNSLIELVDTVLTGGGNVGGTQRNATIAMTGASRLPDAVLNVNNVLISGVQGAGIYLSDAAFTSDSQNLVVESAADYPIALTAMALGSIPTGSYTGNAHDEAYVVENPNIFDNLTISTPLPIHFAWDFINVGARAPVYVTNLTLTLQAGVTLEFEPGSTAPTLITFGSTGSGVTDYNAALIVNGTAQSPVTFTSAKAAPAPGDWAGLNLLTANGSLIDHAIIEYAGGDASSSIGALNCGPFENSALRYPHTAPLLVGDSNDLGYVVISQMITNSTLRFNAGNFDIDALWDSTLFGPDQTPTNTFVDNTAKVCTQSKNLLTNGCTVNTVDESGCLVP